MTKILEVLRKWAWLAVVVTGVLAAIFFINSLRIGAAYAEAKKAFTEKLAIYEAQIKMLDDENESLLGAHFVSS